MHLLIDADSLIYKVACPCETKMYNLYNVKNFDVPLSSFQYKKEAMEHINENYSEEDWKTSYRLLHEVVEVEPVENALHSLKLKIEDILEEAQPNNYSLYLTAGKNFRHNMQEDYKAGRSAKPVLFDNCFQYLVKKYEAEVGIGIEADDLVAMKQTKDTCIAHIDKDLDTVAGLHFNYNHYSFYRLTENEALANFYRQMLVGDRGDNIAGVKGIGEVKAKKFITDDMSEADMYKTVYELYNGDEPLILHTGRMLHMTRELDSNGDPVLWEIPNGLR